MKRYLWAMLACVALVLSACSMPMGISESDFEEALSSDSALMQGFASNDYVEVTPYALTSFECTNISKQEQGYIDANVHAVIENESFQTELYGVGYYSEDYGFSFAFDDIRTTPLRGIDFDDDHGLASCESRLSDDSRSCMVDAQSTNELWFVTETTDTTYSYGFDGTAWRFEDSNDVITRRYHDIEGAYEARVGDLANDVTSFVIRDLDEERGTFVIDYSADVYDRYWTGLTVEGVTGSISAAIDSEKSAWELGPGSYYFEGGGSSNAGNGQASITGFLTTADSGEHSIEVIQFSIDAGEVASKYLRKDNLKGDYYGSMYAVE